MLEHLKIIQQNEQRGFVLFLADICLEYILGHELINYMQNLNINKHILSEINIFEIIRMSKIIL